MLQEEEKYSRAAIKRQQLINHFSDQIGQNDSSENDVRIPDSQLKYVSAFDKEHKFYYLDQLNQNFHEEFLNLLDDKGNIITVFEFNFRKILTGETSEQNTKFKDHPLNREGFCLVVLSTFHHKVEQKVYLMDAAINLFTDISNYFTARGQNMVNGISWRQVTSYFIDVTIE